ncbi:MAG: type II secretion system F family protein, partial [Gemmataceae bacterium]
AGLPLDQGLAALAREMGRGPLKQVTAEIAADLRAGHTLPEALQRRGDRLPPYYAGLVLAGVRTGRISEVLATLTVYARSVAEMRSTITSALLYPAMVLLFAGGLFAFLAFFILPQFTRIFADFNMMLPVMTQVAIAVGTHPLEVVVLPLVLVIAAVFLTRAALGRTAWGRIAWARFVYSLPIIGTLIRSSRLATFSELLAIMVKHQIPLPEAFRLAGSASSDPLLQTAAGKVEGDLAQGQTLAQALRERRLVPELIVWMLGLGEQRGTLGATLSQIAEVYRRQADLRAGMLRSVLPSLMIIVTAGGIVGFFLLSIMLPLVKLLEGLSK